MVSARLGADYIQYITLKEHARENDEDNSGREREREGWGVGGYVEETYKGF